MELDMKDTEERSSAVLDFLDGYIWQGRGFYGSKNYRDDCLLEGDR